MNLEQRILKLEKSNKYYKIALSICICLFFISAKDVFIKDEIQVKKLIADEIEVNEVTSNSIYSKKIEINKGKKDVGLFEYKLKDLPYSYVSLTPNRIELFWGTNRKANSLDEGYITRNVLIDDSGLILYKNGLFVKAFQHF